MKNHIKLFNVALLVFVAGQYSLIHAAALVPAAELSPSQQLINYVCNDKIEMVQATLQQGADVDVQDDNGRTALMFASFHGYKGIAVLLLDRGADINMKDDYGQTALMYASLYRYKGMAVLLLDRGADINMKNVYGETALMIASFHGHKDVDDLLKVYMLLKPYTQEQIRMVLQNKIAPSKPNPNDIAQWLEDEQEEINPRIEKMYSDPNHMNQAIENYWFYQFYTAWHAMYASNDPKPLEKLFFTDLIQEQDATHDIRPQQDAIHYILPLFKTDVNFKQAIKDVADKTHNHDKALKIIQKVEQLERYDIGVYQSDQESIKKHEHCERKQLIEGSEQDERKRIGRQMHKAQNIHADQVFTDLHKLYEIKKYEQKS